GIDHIPAIVRDKLARFKHPRTYTILDALPRNTMGKVQKNVLREAHQDEALEPQDP
ncbi:MAG: malonyl-CoA synthase, partial [Pseudomonadota bacterium]